MVEQITFQTIFQFLQTIGILVGVFYYIMTISANQRNQQLQLETRQTQLFMSIYARFTENEFLKANRLFKATPIEDPEDWNRKYDWFNDEPEFPEFIEAVDLMVTFYTGLNLLIEEELLDIKLLAKAWGGPTIRSWEKVAPFVKATRVQMGNPDFLECL